MAVDVSEAVVATLEAVGQAFMVDTQQVHHGGLEVVYVHGVIHHVETEVIGDDQDDVRRPLCDRRIGGAGLPGHRSMFVYRIDDRVNETREVIPVLSKRPYTNCHHDYSTDQALLHTFVSMTPGQFRLFE